MSDATTSPSRLKVSWLIGTLAAFALFAVIGAYSSRMTWNTLDYDQERAAQRYDTLAKLRDEAKKTLTTADWIDQAKGIVRIPIEEAMAREIDTLKGQPAQAGCEIPAPPAAIPPTAGATNAAPTVAGPATATTKPAAPAAKKAAPTPPPAPAPTNK